MLLGCLWKEEEQAVSIQDVQPDRPIQCLRVDTHRVLRGWQGVAIIRRAGFLACMVFVQIRDPDVRDFFRPESNVETHMQRRTLYVLTLRGEEGDRWMHVDTRAREVLYMDPQHNCSLLNGIIMV